MVQVEIVRNCKRIIANIDAITSIDGSMYFACPEGRPVANRLIERFTKTRDGRRSYRNNGRKPR